MKYELIYSNVERERVGEGRGNEKKVEGGKETERQGEEDDM